LRVFLRNWQARFVTFGPAGAVPGHLRLGVHVSGIITLAIIGAASGNRGPRPGPYVSTLEVL
jgi:hypothetical protein